MDLLEINAFSFLILVTGGIFLITGVIYRFIPPKTETWYTMQLKSAHRSRETFKEAIRFSAKPIAFAGVIFLLVGKLTFFFGSDFFNFSLAILLILTTCMILVSLINHHLDRLFDKEGNRK